MQLDDFYGPRRQQPADVTASFECREAVPSPCTGGQGTGTWSQHAYGLAVDVNPNENPYVGCGQSRDPTLRKYRNRSRHLKGMVTPRAIQAFQSIGCRWGGSWAGNTKDSMHFSSTGGYPATSRAGPSRVRCPRPACGSRAGCRCRRRA
jgi:D-alanyl-D-alanine carboxypeptidase